MDAKLRELPEYVYVVGAFDTDTERVASLQVHTDLKRAQWVFGELKIVYGGANVFMASRAVDVVDIGAPVTFGELFDAEGV